MYHRQINFGGIWLDKVDFIEEHHGMALVNSHPDYLREKNTWDVYLQFLLAMKERDGYWCALPCEVASWWRVRSTGGSNKKSDFAVARLLNGKLELG